MNRRVKRVGLGFALLLILGVAALLFGSMLGEQKRQRSVDITVQPVAWATDALAMYAFLKTVPARTAVQR